MSSSMQYEDNIRIEHLYTISEIISQSTDWKPALEHLSRYLRTIFIYDNMVIYNADPATQSIDVFYARAIGRGRRAEADLAWGENIANRITERPQIVNEEPETIPELDRLQRPYFLGLPVTSGRYLGAIVFIRFGGPSYTDKDIKLATFVSHQIANLLSRIQINKEKREIEAKHQQMQLQENFISTISHELRSPLGFIKGYTTTLLRSDTSWDQSVQQEFLEIIDQETDKLLELITNLLDSARLQSGQLRIVFSFVRIEPLLTDLIARAEIQYPKLVIQAKMASKHVSIMADATRLTQVLDNLVSNAVKYAPGSKIVINIKEQNDGIMIDFQDFGPGISDEHLPYLFERFYRVIDPSKSPHGTGLGLYICKQIIEEHHGDITVESVVGKGTIFHIYLPFQPKNTSVHGLIPEEKS